MKTRWIVSLILGLFLVCAFAQHSPKPKKTRAVITATPWNSTETQNTANQHQEASPNQSPTPSPTSTVNTPATETEGRKSEQKPTNVWEKAISPETFSTWALVLVGVVGVILALCTLSALRQQIRDGKIVARAAKQSAVTATKSAESEERVLRLTERADVLIDDMFSTTPGHFNAATRLKFDIKNFGRTRANNVLVRGWITLSEVDFERPPASQFAPPVVISPEKMTPVIIRQNPGITAQDIADIEGGRKTAFFALEIIYTDVFGDAHHTRNTGTFNLADQTFPALKNDMD